MRLVSELSLHLYQYHHGTTISRCPDEGGCPHSQRALRYFEKQLPWSDPALLRPAAMNSFAPLIVHFLVKGKATGNSLAAQDFREVNV